MSTYKAPSVKDLGSISDKTLVNIPKNGTSGDTITINGQTVAVPGSSLA